MPQFFWSIVGLIDLCPAGSRTEALAYNSGNPPWRLCFTDWSESIYSSGICAEAGYLYQTISTAKVPRQIWRQAAAATKDVFELRQKANED